MRIKLLKVITKGMSERGCETPNRKNNSFIRSPPSIRKAILSPMENRRVSIQSSPSSFNNLTRMKPGIKVK